MFHCQATSSSAPIATPSRSGTTGCAWSSNSGPELGSKLIGPSEASRTVVPTWNYVTVQAHGTITTVHDLDWLISHLGRLVARHEGGRQLGQNGSDADIEGTISGLNAGTPTERAVAERMARDR